MDQWLDHYRIFWQTNLASLKNFVETEYAKEQEEKKQQPEAKKQKKNKHHKFQ